MATKAALKALPREAADEVVAIPVVAAHSSREADVSSSFATIEMSVLKRTTLREK